jgi:hypothetical protein
LAAFEGGLGSLHNSPELSLFISMNSHKLSCVSTVSGWRKAASSSRNRLNDQLFILHSPFQQFLAGTKLPRVAGPDPKYPDVCFSGAGENLADVAQHFPAVSFEMGGWQGGIWSLELAPENFMFKHSDVAGAYCLGIFENQDAGSLIGGEHWSVGCRRC